MTNTHSRGAFAKAIRAIISFITFGVWCNPKDNIQPFHTVEVLPKYTKIIGGDLIDVVQEKPTFPDRGLGPLLNADSPAVENPVRGGTKKVEHRGNEIEIHGGKRGHALLVVKVALTAFFRANETRLISLARMRELLPELAFPDDRRLYNAMRHTLCRLELLKQVQKGRARGSRMGENTVFAVMVDKPGYIIRTIEADFFGEYGALTSNELTQIILRAKNADGSFSTATLGGQASV